MNKCNALKDLSKLAFIGLLLLVFLSSIQLFAQENQTVIVSGRGTDCNEAEKDAYKKGIEQAGGAYYASNKRMLNRQIVKESIDVLKSGSVLKTETLSSCRKSVDGTYEIIMSVTVSQTELKKFVESKGKAVGISGQEMVQKKRMEEQAEANELNVIKNILRQLENLASDPFDFFWEPGQTKFLPSYKVEMPGKVIVQYNQNYFNIGKKIIGELNDISLKPADIEFRKKYLGKEPVVIIVNGETYYLRNLESKIQLLEFYKRLNLKNSEYLIVDGSNKKLEHLNTKQTFFTTEENGELLFPKSGKVYKEVKGNLLISEADTERLNRINIFSKQREKEIKQSRTLANDLNLYFYSETNPLEYANLRDSLERLIEKITLERQEGRLNFEYKIAFSGTGKNKSDLLFKYGPGSVFQFEIEDALKNVNLTPSMIGDKYTKSKDSILVDLKWNSKKEKIIYTANQNVLANNFKSLNLPYGKYQTELKKKELNGLTFYDQKILNYNTRGPWTAVNSILLPGWGTRKVTYNEKNGWGRFAMVVVPLLTSFAFEMMSQNNYNNYRETDISVDGNMASSYYKRANNQRKASLVFAGIGMTAYVFNISWVINQGIKNKKKKKRINDLINQEEGIYLRQQSLKL